MQISKSNLTRIMHITDLSKRKAKLQEYCLSIGWHGEYFFQAMNELKRLEALGIKTALETRLSENKNPA